MATKAFCLVWFFLELQATAVAWESLVNPLPSQIMMPVALGRSSVREKRGAVPMTQPLRVLPVFADNVNTNLQEKATLVQETIIPKLLDFLQQSLSVAPLSGPILINNRCTTNAILRDTVSGEIKCGAQCAPTMCGLFQVPQEHLKQCIQCNTDGSSVTLADCVPGTPAEDGAGAIGYDFILYITADQSACPQALGGAQIVAFATACQNEVDQDRPVAGAINFCPDGVRNRDPDFAFAISKHEVLHALGFSSFLFALWRDPDTNMPRTPRSAVSGLPAVDNGVFVIDESTIEPVTYNDWVTRAGTVQHDVLRMVTPAVMREARRHFNCPSLAGVELENQGGPGTAMEHWEKRVLGNEAMTGQVTFNPVFSRLTFAALEDSGWYSVNYSLADELVWGRDAGCRFAEGSCGEWLNQQTSNDGSLAPFCNVPLSSSSLTLSCTVDREAVSRCNLMSGLSIPTEYQYFQDPGLGGSVVVTDYCPFQDVFTYASSGGGSRGTTCSVSSNAPPFNVLLEEYGPGSRCLTHGRQWTVNGGNVQHGGGCYQYSCDADQVTITIAGQELVCACSQAGQEVVVDVTVDGAQHQGSILCPPCTSICHAPSKNIMQRSVFTVTTDGGSEQTPPGVGNGSVSTPPSTASPGGGNGGTSSVANVRVHWLSVIAALLLITAHYYF